MSLTKSSLRSILAHLLKEGIDVKVEKEDETTTFSYFLSCRYSNKSLYVAYISRAPYSWKANSRSSIRTFALYDGERIEASRVGMYRGYVEHRTSNKYQQLPREEGSTYLTEDMLDSFL